MSLQVFRKYPSMSEAKSLIDLLNDNDVPYKVEDYSKNVGINFLGELAELKIFIKVNINDFPKVDQLINQNLNIKIEDVEKDHYLFTFSEKELMEIILKSNEWSNYDVKVAEILLKNKGFKIDDKLINTIKNSNYNDEETNKESQSFTWIVVGYISALFGGLIGFGIGLSLWLMKKKLPNGAEIYSYSEENRKHGKRITIIGLISTLIFILLRLKLFSV